MKTQAISQTLKELANPAIAEHSQRFFKTGKGEYGEGDRFLGIRVPILREQAKKYQEIALTEIQLLLKSSFHEERLCALLLLVRKFAKGNEAEKATIYNLYLNNTKYINNWDLVDSSAHQIAGAYLESKDKQTLHELAQSDSLWERRIAIMSTFHFIKKNQFEDALAISQKLLKDQEDLIHKAVGWMLREMGKRKVDLLRGFLAEHASRMPRTMLRYSIEKMSSTERQHWLNQS